LPGNASIVADQGVLSLADLRNLPGSYSGVFDKSGLRGNEPNVAVQLVCELHDQCAIFSQFY
jgi:hypothetical protein